MSENKQPVVIKLSIETITAGVAETFKTCRLNAAQTWRDAAGWTEDERWKELCLRHAAVWEAAANNPPK